MIYQLVRTGAVRRLADNAFIPQAPGNRDYQDYLQWVSEGNTPNPYGQRFNKSDPDGSYNKKTF
jgi:lysine/ornithine N-monooxygenase